MRKKYYNDAFIGNEKVTCSFTKYGELLRLYYPTPDYRQYFDFFHIGIKVNDSNIIYLHNDINNTYNQFYVQDTNILTTEVYNHYFKLKINQIDFAIIDRAVIVKKYEFINENNYDLNLDFLVHSKLMSSFNNMAGGYLRKDSLYQYSHNYTVAIFSDENIKSSQMNNVERNIDSGIVYDKDYIGMSPNSAISYGLGVLKPNEKRAFTLFLYLKNEDNNINFMMEEVEVLKQTNVNYEYERAKKYWNDYLKSHNTFELKHIDGLDNHKIEQIYKRTILFIPHLVNEETGGIVATLEVDEERDESGRYSYCWPRDAVKIYSNLNCLNFNNFTELFYEKFLKRTQMFNGMWEQRFFTDGTLAPCWGYQIDETASIIWGAYKYYETLKHCKNYENKKFLYTNMKMLEKAIKFVDFYVENELKNSTGKLRKSYDLWEMNEGISLYGIASIYGAYDSMEKMCNILGRECNIVYREKKAYLRKYVLENLVDKQKNVLKRNNTDGLVDISILGAVIPFEMFDLEEEIVKNTVLEIEKNLKTFNYGFLRFPNDNYIGGKSPWIIATAWMGMYYKKVGRVEEAKKAMEFILNASTPLGLLPEQSSIDFSERWIIGLGWSHAMFIAFFKTLME